MQFPLPPYAHAPGRNARHDSALFAGVKAATPKHTVSDEAATNPAWRYGLELLEAGFFWECHEALEPVWANAAPNSRERAAVQGVIQLANAALKLEMGRPTAAQRLAAAAQGLFAAATADDGMAMMLDRGVVEAAVAALADGRRASFVGLASFPKQAI